jgi:hypothetical protein
VLLALSSSCSVSPILAYVLANYMIRGASVPGFTFLSSLIAIFSGAQLFALGVFGEYLARMHFRTMDRPPYLVGETVVLPEPDTVVAESDSDSNREHGIV